MLEQRQGAHELIPTTNIGIPEYLIPQWVQLSRTGTGVIIDSSIEALHYARDNFDALFDFGMLMSAIYLREFFPTLEAKYNLTQNRDLLEDYYGHMLEQFSIGYSLQRNLQQRNRHDWLNNQWDISDQVAKRLRCCEFTVFLYIKVFDRLNRLSEKSEAPFSGIVGYGAEEVSFQILIPKLLQGLQISDDIEKLLQLYLLDDNNLTERAINAQTN